MKNLLVLLVINLLFSCQESSKNVKESQVQSTEEMLQHNVYFYLHDSISSDRKKEFEKSLQELLSIDEIHKSEVGVTASTKHREVTDHEFDYSLFIWFKSMEDYQVYADHPVHLKFIEENKHLWTTVKVYDSEIIASP